jgi:hypothetical protein
MLARMNFAAQLAGNQKFNIRDLARGHASTPEDLVFHLLDRLSPPEYSSLPMSALLEYAGAGERWTGSDAQLATKGSGIVHLILGSGDYQLV